MKITDKMRLDFLHQYAASVPEQPEEGHFNRVLRILWDGNANLYLRQAIDAAIRAERRRAKP